MTRVFRALTLLLSLALAVPTTAAEKLGGNLRWLLSEAPAAKAVRADSAIPVLVRFHEAPTPRALESLETDGHLRWRRYEQQILGATTVFLAEADHEQLQALSKRADILRIEADWSPVKRLTLDETVPLSGVHPVWIDIDSEGQELTGLGVRIADLDSGVDIHHPALMRKGTERLSWFDDDGGELTGNGGEWVDLDDDGSRDANETLRLIESFVSSRYPEENQPGYDPDIDWLYADIDNDGQRDRVPDDGWVDSDPSMGEPLFVSNGGGDGTLDSIDQIFPLTESKIELLREPDGTIHYGNSNLSEAPNDPYNHGTQVCGILAGGWTENGRFTGVAPDATLLVGMISYDTEPRFWQTLPELATWAVSSEADVILIEDGEWAWELMDGSSNDEVLLSELARDHGVVVVTASGNLAGGGQHERQEIAAGSSYRFAIDVSDPPTALWINFNWIGELDDLTWSLTLPFGSRIEDRPVPTIPETIILGGSSARVEMHSDRSAAGTSMLALRIGANSLPTGNYQLNLINHREETLKIDGWKWDDVSGWGSDNRFAEANDEGTVTFPATAEGMIVVGAYAGRFDENNFRGDLNTFSGRGTSLAGDRLVDLVAPGSPTFSSGNGTGHGITGPWVRFGGTSAALPHVAGTAALLRQLTPGASQEAVEAALIAGTVRDGQTGDVPNVDWGWGKLDASAAVAAMREIVGRSIAITEPAADATVQDGDSVKVEIEGFELDCAALGSGPALANGGFWALLLDDLEIDRSCTDEALISASQAGTATLTVRLMDASGQAVVPAVEASIEVTVEIPEEPDLPAPHWLLPAIARLEGEAGSLWRSAVWIDNPGSEAVELDLRFAGQSSTVSLAAGAGFSSDDILGELFNLEGPSFGSLILVSTAADARRIIASARTCNLSDDGTYGQYLQAVAIPEVVPAKVVVEHWLAGLAGGESSRSNIGIANLWETPTTAIVQLVDENGSDIGTPQTVDLAGYGIEQLNAVDSLAGVPGLDPYAARISAGSPVAVYASRLDQITSDPIYLPSGLPVASEQWIDGLASVVGEGGIPFLSDLALFNPGDSATTVTLAYTNRNGTAITDTASVDLAAGATSYTTDLLGTLIDGTGSAGNMKLISGSPVQAWVRTYSDLGDEGTLGQLIPAVGAAGLLDGPAILQGLRQDEDFRTNLGLLNVSDEAVEVEVRVRDSDGGILGSTVLPMAPGQARQLTRVVSILVSTEAEISSGSLWLEASVPGTILAWSSTIDNRSADPTFVRPVSIGAPSR